MTEGNKGFFDKIKVLDVLGSEYTFEVDGSKAFKTVLGSITTIILFIGISAYAYMFGKEVWEKKTPVVSSSSEYIAASRINITDIPVIISIHNIYGAPYNDNLEEIFEFEIENMKINQYVVTTDDKFKGNNDCNPDNFTSHKDYVAKTVEMAKQANMRLICLNMKENLYVQNEYVANDSSFISLHIKKCDPNKRKCVDKLEEITTIAYVVIRTLDSYIDPTNYLNPVIYFEQSFTQQIGNKFLKNTFFRFSIGEITTNYGWLFDDNKFLNYNYISSIKEDINPSLDNSLYWITFESPQIRIKTVRSYLKITEVFARVGGLYTGIIILLTTFLQNYSQFKFYKHIYYTYKEKTSSIKYEMQKNFIEVSTPIINKKIKKGDETKISKFQAQQPKEEKSSFADIKNIQNQQSALNIRFENLSKKDSLFKNIDETSLKLNYIGLICAKYICCCAVTLLEIRLDCSTCLSNQQKG